MKRYIQSAVQRISDMDIDTAWEIASDPGTSAITLKDMASSVKYSLVMDEVIHNPNTDAEILDILAHRDDLNGDNYWTLASRKQISGDSLDALLTTLMSKYNDKIRSRDYILEEIALNPNVKLETLISLINIAIQYSLDGVMGSVVRSPNANLDIIRVVLSRDEYFIGDVLCSPAVDVNFIEELMATDSNTIHCGIAKDKRTPPYMLEQLANDDYYSTRHAVAENMNTPVDTLKELLDDEEVNVRIAAKITLRNLGVEL